MAAAVVLRTDGFIVLPTLPDAGPSGLTPGDVAKGQIYQVYRDFGSARGRHGIVRDRTVSYGTARDRTGSQRFDTQYFVLDAAR